MKKYIFIIILFLSIITVACVSNDGNGGSDEPIIVSEPTLTPEPTPMPSPEPPFAPDGDEKYTPDPTPEPFTSKEDEKHPQPKFGFIDAHADTPSRILTLDQFQRSLYENSDLHLDFKRLSEFEAAVQVFVAWCPGIYVDVAFEHTNLMFDVLEQEIEKHSDLIEIALDLNDVRRIANKGKISAILAIEGGEALMGKIENLYHFYNRGVRILAPTWNRENELGFGHALNKTEGLKPFGIECIKKMDELGMIIDVSHLNEAGFWDVHNIGTRPYMASHSNAYSILEHSRNLNDAQIMAIVERGGIIGFNMYKPFVSTKKTATINDIMAHFKHWIDIGAGDHIGLGCDFDGIDEMPEGITDVSSLKILAEELKKEFDEETSFKIMEGNFYDFFKRYFEG